MDSICHNNNMLMMRDEGRNIRNKTGFVIVTLIYIHPDSWLPKYASASSLETNCMVKTHHSHTQLIYKFMKASF